MRKSNLFGCSVSYVLICFTFTVSCSAAMQRRVNVCEVLLEETTVGVGEQKEGGRKERVGVVYMIWKGVWQRAGNLDEITLFLLKDAKKIVQFCISFYLEHKLSHFFSSCLLHSVPPGGDVWSVEICSGAGSQGLTPAWLMGDRDKGLIRAILPIWMSCQCSVQYI